MKLIDILTDLLKEESGNVFFLLKPTDILDALVEDFYTNTPSMQKLISRGISPVDISNAMDNLLGLTFSGTDSAWKELESEANASKSELAAAKRDVDSFVGTLKKDVPAISNVFKAVYAAYDKGDESLMTKLSPQYIDTYLKYYTSDVVNKKTNIRSSEDYKNLIGALKDLTTKNEEWSQKYKNSIDCNNPKGFSQRAHCAGRKKH
jgi:hypothetical protein